MKKLFKRIAHKILDKPDYSVSIQITPVTDECLLKDCRAMITGGSKGIGREIAIRIVQCGGKCVITGRDEGKMVELNDMYPQISYIQYDMRDIEGYSQLYEVAEEKLGGTINSLILNAGISNHESSITDVSYESFQEQIDINLKANFFMLKEYGKLISVGFREERNVLVISSETADMPYDIPYGLTKASLNRLIEGFSHRFYKSGCRINGIAPGEVYTDMEKSAGIIVDDIFGYARRNCMGRLMDPKEIAEVGVFLLSKRSMCISGEIIHCNANNHMKSYLD